MSLLDHTPQLTSVQAEALARDLFAIDGRATELPSERDRNFRIDSADGSYVLKVANSTELLETLEAQSMAAGLCADAAIPVQRQYRTVNGEWVAQFDGHYVRVFDYLDGTLLADVQPCSQQLRYDLGAVLGRVANALEGFDHPALHREFHWDVARTADVIAERAPSITDADRRVLVERFADRFSRDVVALLSTLPHAIIHGDANDRNVLVDAGEREQPAERFRKVSGLLDFGDAVYSVVIADAAIAAAYLTFDVEDPIGAVCDVVAAFDAQHRLTDDELAVVWNLVLARQCLSVVNAAVQTSARPDDDYLRVSEEPAWRSLARLLEINTDLARYRIRAACGREPHPNGQRIREFLAQSSPAPLLGTEWNDLRLFAVDLSVDTPLFGISEMSGTAEQGDAIMRSVVDGDADAIGLGGYGEPRLFYTSPAYASSEDPASERRTIHLGLDVWTRAGVPLHAPLAGVVHIAHDNDAPLDYGPVVVLRHTTPEGDDYFSLYGHLARETLAHVHVGQQIAQGEIFAWVGDSSVNGGWAPHAHVQVILDLLDLAHDYPGVGVPSQRNVWLGLSPDPALLLQLPEGSTPPRDRSAVQTLADRKRLLGPNLSISYDPPLRIVRGMGHTLYDDQGRSYLDAVNNVAHVGHCHPHVVRAGARQMAVLNTNTRYLHEEVLRYAERLTATLPGDLSVCFFVNSGSEANDLALRIAQAHTGRRDVIALENGYHGHTQALIDVSHYKNAGAGGSGAPEWVHTAVMPDAYRGEHRGYSRDTALAYAQDIGRCISEAEPAAFIAESMVGCGGQIVLPDGYLGDAAALVHAAGGLMIADEVQVGFGRVGPAFWGFVTQGLVPDIVSMGKPAGNGHPLAVVVTTPEIAASFANGMEYFNTFGGNPVSAAIGNAVLDVLEIEQLPQRAETVGARIVAGARELAQRHELIGDVRGLGMYIGIELVRDRQSLEPAAAEASYVIEQCKRRGVLVSTDGPLHNVLKIKPPIVWGEAEADRLIDTLDRVLSDSALGR